MNQETTVKTYLDSLPAEALREGGLRIYLSSFTFIIVKIYSIKYTISRASEISGNVVERRQH